MKITSVERTEVGKVRSENQDSIFSRAEHGLYMVADGMGGEKAGAEASAQVVTTIDRVTAEFFNGSGEKTPAAVEKTLRQALADANADVFGISVKEPDKAGLGSTGTLLCLHRGVYFVSHVGDSRAYLLRDGSVVQLTRDHSVVWALYENGLITRDQLETHPERNLLTQCVGQQKTPEIDTFEGRIEQGDIYLLCSDGLTGYAGEKKVEELLRDRSEDMQACSDAMFEAAMEGGGGDNVSVILVRVDELAPEDSWIPEETPAPRKLTLPEEHRRIPLTVETKPQPARGRTKLMAAALGAIVVLALILAAIQSRGRSIQAELALPPSVAGDPFVELDKLQIDLLDENNELVASALVGREGNIITVRVPDSGKYLVQLSAPGMVSIEQTIILIRGEKAPQKLQTELSGRLRLEVKAATQISLLRIYESGGETDFYKFEASGEAGGPTPRLIHDLYPGKRYIVEAVDKQGIPWEETVLLGARSEDTIRIVF